ncbi:MAG: hypothetical protein GVY08_05965 [Bacteroidetes bacterium]|jgi:predicted esterase|nr:hypothetical protein [Bacteroidota bacterium]
MKEPETHHLMSDHEEFSINVPYQVVESGERGVQKPLIIYLHGFGQTLESFKDDAGSLFWLEAYHLFIQAPYPLYDRSRRKKIRDWGRSWYLYDGDQEQFRKSLDHASHFVHRIIQKVADSVPATRVCLIGFSMGGYLAGYHAIRYPDHVNELIMYGARYKSEFLIGGYEKISHQSILGLHGNDDKNVEPGPQKEEMRRLRQHEIDAAFEDVNESHRFSKAGAGIMLDWLADKGYKCKPDNTFN